MKLIDLSADARGSWKGTLDMLSELCGQTADLSFGWRTVGDMKVPTLEIRLDDPASLTSPRISDYSGTAADRWTRGVVVLSDVPPESLPGDLPAWTMRPACNAAVLYRAFREMARVLDSVPIVKEFSWSSMLLAPVCDDPELTYKREAILYRAGAVHTMWLRCPDDEVLKASLCAAPPCGRLQAQNMTTANTWAAGALDEPALMEACFRPGAPLNRN
jgi:hypothetical protein